MVSLVQSLSQVQGGIFASAYKFTVFSKRKKDPSCSFLCVSSWGWVFRPDSVCRGCRGWSVGCAEFPLSDPGARKPWQSLIWLVTAFSRDESGCRTVSSLRKGGEGKLKKMLSLEITGRHFEMGTLSSGLCSVSPSCRVRGPRASLHWMLPGWVLPSAGAATEQPVSCRRCTLTRSRQSWMWPGSQRRFLLTWPPPARANRAASVCWGRSSWGHESPAGCGAGKGNALSYSGFL